MGFPGCSPARPKARPEPWQALRDNYTKAWVESHFSAFFLNSVVVTLTSLAGVLAISAMASYVLARFRFRGAQGLYLYFISGMMVPAQLLLVPLFFQYAWISQAGSTLLAPLGYELRLHDSLAGLVLLYIALSLPFTILVLTGFFKSLPGELREAGIIDGCGEYRVFWHVMLPLARPGMVSVAIFNFLGLWNEYLFALVFLNTPEKRTPAAGAGQRQHAGAVQDRLWAHVCGAGDRDCAGAARVRRFAEAAHARDHGGRAEGVGACFKRP
ncbi:MAG: carbohydrate ABC transporter permease [Candidatus Competibacteraceae bacterium]|nr:carbohydrate ABC transporter permease [Candidatus Competibacteraceae bacterium]